MRKENFIPSLEAEYSSCQIGLLQFVIAGLAVGGVQ